MADNVFITSLLRPFIGRGQAGPFAVPGALRGGSRILAIDSGDLTDLLFHAPLLQGIRECHPGAEIDFLVPEEHASLVASSGLARQCLVFGSRQLRPWSPSFAGLLRSVRQGRYDVALLMSLSPQPLLELAALATGARLRYGPSHKRGYPSINFEIRPPRTVKGYRGRRPAHAAAFLGLSPDSLGRGWPLPADRLRQTQQLVHFNKPRREDLLVGVDPGLGKEGHGISLHNLHFLVKQLSSQALCRVLPLSDPRNLDRVRRFADGLAGPPPGLTWSNLLEGLLLLAQCDLFVAGNTDLFHFGAALQVPTIGVFTARDGPEWEPGPVSTVRVLRVTKGERVDIDTLMESVESVTGGLEGR